MAQAVTQNFENWQARLDKLLHEKNAFTDLLDKAESKTGVRRLYLVLGLAVFLGLYLMVGWGSDFLCCFIGFLYPAYASVKAIETHEKDDDTKWLTYWVIFSAFSLIEFFTDIFLFWIPFYSFLKCLFLLYCMVPAKWNGSAKIYHNMIKPFVLKHQKKVDAALDKLEDTAQHVIDEGTEVLGDATAEQMKDQMRDASKLE